MHMTAIGGLCGFLLVWGMNYQGDVRNAFILFLLLSGILATSRLYLKKTHSFAGLSGFFASVCFFVFGTFYRSVDFVNPKYLAGRVIFRYSSRAAFASFCWETFYADTISLGRTGSMWPDNWAFNFFDKLFRPFFFCRAETPHDNMISGTTMGISLLGKYWRSMGR